MLCAQRMPFLHGKNGVWWVLDQTPSITYKKHAGFINRLHSCSLFHLLCLLGHEITSYNGSATSVSFNRSRGKGFEPSQRRAADVE